MEGFKEVMGSWKIMEIFSPRIPLLSLSPIFNMSFPSNMISPEVTFPGGVGRSPMMVMAVVVLPAPVSPTNPSVSLGSRVKFMLFTAYTIPSSVLYVTLKSLISSNFSFSTICSAFH